MSTTRNISPTHIDMGTTSRYKSSPTHARRSCWSWNIDAITASWRRTVGRGKQCRRSPPQRPGRCEVIEAFCVLPGKARKEKVAVRRCLLDRRLLSKRLENTPDQCLVKTRWAWGKCLESRKYVNESTWVKISGRVGVKLKHARSRQALHPFSYVFKMGKELFISYGREPEVTEFVQKLKSDLEKNGFRVWLDSTDISAGCDWHAAIGTGLHNCKALLAIITPK